LKDYLIFGRTLNIGLKRNWNKRENRILKLNSFKIYLLVCIIYSAGIAYAIEQPRDFSKFPVKGMLTMIDLGAEKCVPCKMMAPIIVKIEKVYKGKADIVFIDVWKNRDQASRFGIRGIPTQIFFDRDGEEVFRHLGFMGEEQIVEQLKKMGVK
jgi:thioredoxin 1